MLIIAKIQMYISPGMSNARWISLTSVVFFIASGSSGWCIFGFGVCLCVPTSILFDKQNVCNFVSATNRMIYSVG